MMRNVLEVSRAHLRQMKRVLFHLSERSCFLFLEAKAQDLNQTRSNQEADSVWVLSCQEGGCTMLKLAERVWQEVAWR